MFSLLARLMTAQPISLIQAFLTKCIFYRLLTALLLAAILQIGIKTGNFELQQPSKSV